MKRLLARPARGSQTGRWSRQNLLKVLFAITAAVVLAFIGWAFVDTARLGYTAPVLAQAEDIDYGHLADLLLANDKFPSDGLLSQLQSYVTSNSKLRGDEWTNVSVGLNSTCPVKYNRLRLVPLVLSCLLCCHRTSD